MAVRTQRARRRGATAAETAIVLIPLTMFVFGIFEYSRFLMDWDLLNNAAREGCRFALANNTDANINSEVQNVVTTFMAGQDSSFSGFTISVSGVHNGTSYSGNNVNNLSAGDLITVTVSGTYRFMGVIPLVKVPTTLSMSSSVTMVCEGAS